MSELHRLNTEIARGVADSLSLMTQMRETRAWADWERLESKLDEVAAAIQEAVAMLEGESGVRTDLIEGKMRLLKSVTNARATLASERLRAESHRGQGGQSQ